jgi:hypothetical protein
LFDNWKELIKANQDITSKWEKDLQSFKR